MKIVKVWFDTENIFVGLDNGVTIGNPLEWYPRLANADKHELEQFQIGPTGYGIHWENLDEDLSVEGFVSLKSFANAL